MFKNNLIGLSSESVSANDDDDYQNHIHINIRPPINDDNGIEVSIKETQNAFGINNDNIPITGKIYGKQTATKLTYKQVESKIDDEYSSSNQDFSSSFDVLASYLKGHKIIYMESSDYCEKNLHKLMMPSIILSTTATVLATAVTIHEWGAILLAAVNATIAFLLALVNYFKLDASSQAHKISAHQYDKLQSSVEFTSGSILLFNTTTYNSPTNKGDNNNHKTILDNELMKKLGEVEKKIMEIKETNQFIIPSYIRNNYPIIFNTNIFSIIKKIYDIKKTKITVLMNIKNQIYYLEQTIFSSSSSDININKNAAKIEEIKTQIPLLINKKRECIEEILMLKSAFSVIDEMFQQEITNANIIKERWFHSSFYLSLPSPEKINPFIFNLMHPFKVMTP